MSSVDKKPGVTGEAYVKDQWFWNWLKDGDRTVPEKNRRPGYRKIVNAWLIVHLSIGGALAFFAPASLEDAANSFLLPLAGIFIGIAFAWAGNAQTLLQTQELETLAQYPGEGYQDWVYEYQLTVLLLLVTLVLWGIGALGVYDELWPRKGSEVVYPALAWMLYTFASLSLRGCWRAVNDTQSLLLTRYRMRRIREDAEIER